MRTVARPPEEVFDWVADHRNVRVVMEGVTRWEPVGAQAEGVGAVYEVGLGGLPIPLRARLVMVEWDRPRAIAWASERSPVANGGRWSFTPRRAGTQVRLEVHYDPPGGPIGDFLAARVEGIVRARVERALDAMKEELEPSD